MATKVDYIALLKAYTGLSLSINSNVLNNFTNTLDDLYTWLEKSNISHECFNNELSMTNELQEDCTTPISNYRQLATVIPMIIKTFSNAETDISNELKELINNHFAFTSMDLFPFVYHEIQKYNEENNVDFRIQGYTTAGDYYLITAYDKSKNYNSRVYFYDKAGRCLGYMQLTDKKDKNSHVGGITYNEEDGILFITGKGGAVNTYNLKDMIDALNQSEIASSSKVGIAKDSDLTIIDNGSVNIANHFSGNTSAATTYYSASEKALYVADCAGAGTLIKYETSWDGKNVNFDSGKVVSKDFASCCQGVATYKDSSGKTYVYASQSYGKDAHSVIKKYEYTDTGLKEVGATTIETPGLEGIQIDEQGNLSGVFENFKDTNNPNKTININVNSTDFSKTLEERSPLLEIFYKEMGEKNQKGLQ